MKKYVELLKSFTNQEGVKVSLWVTAFSMVMLAIALTGFEFENEQAEALCFFSLVVQLIYGIICCTAILKHQKHHKHLVPFLFLNWFIGCFCTNVGIPVQTVHPIPV